MMTTVICVLKTGGDYNLEYVSKLFKAMERHLHVPHEFVCLTDAEGYKQPAIRWEKLQTEWPAWWAKLEMFRPGLIPVGHTVLYFDLDTVLVSDISRLAEFEGQFMMLVAFRNPMEFASGVMGWRGDFSKLYARCLIEQDSCIYYGGKLAWDQVFIKNNIFTQYRISPPTRVQDYVDVCSFKHHIQRNGGVPEDAAVICFHGKPRPHELETAWMEEHWK